MIMIYVAWDIETCPFPLATLSEPQRNRLNKEIRYYKQRKPELSGDEASRRARSLHPALGWICCISAVRAQSGDVGKPQSWTASSSKDEKAMLREFWKTVAGFPDGTVWVTFNGKRFDVPFLVGRSAAHEIEPARTDILDTYPYAHRPHADLACVLQRMSYGLADLCDMLGVPSSKTDLDGSQIAEAVKSGRISDVASYCERDVLATLRCLQHMPGILDL